MTSYLLAQVVDPKPASKAAETGTTTEDDSEEDEQEKMVREIQS